MLIAMIAALSAAGEPNSAKKIAGLCQQSEPQHAGQSLYGDAGQARRLGELPPGNHILAVLRKENGCAKPVIVRSGIGATPRGDR
jgi:hypothetical protein